MINLCFQINLLLKCHCLFSIRLFSTTHTHLNIPLSTLYHDNFISLEYTFSFFFFPKSVGKCISQSFSSSLKFDLPIKLFLSPELFFYSQHDFWNIVYVNSMCFMKCIFHLHLYLSQEYYFLSFSLNNYCFANCITFQVSSEQKCLTLSAIPVLFI